MRNGASDYMLIQHLSRNPFCRRPVDPLPAALSGRREDICFLHPSSDPQGHQCVSALCSVSTLVGAAAFSWSHLGMQWEQGKCGYYYGDGVGISSILMPQLHIMFNSRMVPTCPPHCGYHQLCRARKWLDVCVWWHTHTPTLSPSLQECMARSGSLPFVLRKKL